MLVGGWEVLSLLLWLHDRREGRISKLAFSFLDKEGNDSSDCRGIAPFWKRKHPNASCYEPTSDLICSSAVLEQLALIPWQSFWFWIRVWMSAILWRKWCKARIWGISHLGGEIKNWTRVFPLSYSFLSCFFPAVHWSFQREHKFCFSSPHIPSTFLYPMPTQMQKCSLLSIPSPFVMYSHHIHVSLVLEAGYGQEIITQDSNLKNANLLSREK